MKVTYEEVYDYIQKKTSINKIAVLATAGNDGRVTARSMSIVHDGLNIYFQTDKNFMKVKQMNENTKVAITFENIQIEGYAVNSGNSSLPENSWFCETYKKVHPCSFELYTMQPDQLIFKVSPTLITCWMYKDKLVYRDFLDYTNKKVERLIYKQE